MLCNLFSATWPESVRRMANKYTHDPILVVIGSLDLTAVKSVKQNLAFVDEDEKYDWVSTVNTVCLQQKY